MAGLADAIFPLVGVVVGGGITTGFEVWKRRQDRHDHNLDLLVEVVLGVQESGTDAIHRADLFSLDLVNGVSFEAVMESGAFNVYNQAAARYLSAIARARILAADALRYNLIEAQDALNEMLVAARDAAAAISTPEHMAKVTAYSQHVQQAREMHNAFILGAIAYLESARSTKPRRIKKKVKPSAQQ